MHIDWQQITTLAIVAAAAFTVGRRLWGQVAGFRAKPGKTAGSGCDGCPSAGTAPKALAPLMQISTRPPAHLRRPPTQ